ncbi:hypothetical protein TSAR_013288 [Trichomalopsis sarcophagae]|uniref:Uncharacterized protein n=1 Tax=Trichomalopsis sarcophagae TaxID=543379 RepID=A0A232FAH3_9HYME|nr:hypothetical protein TSAR_013288 [Trichomalopsis sarcophagae]
MKATKCTLQRDLNRNVCYLEFITPDYLSPIIGHSKQLDTTYGLVDRTGRRKDRENEKLMRESESRAVKVVGGLCDAIAASSAAVASRQPSSFALQFSVGYVEARWCDVHCNLVLRIKYVVMCKYYAVTLDLQLNFWQNLKKTTALFIKFVARRFRLVTSRYSAEALGKLHQSTYENNINFLNEFVELFTNLKVDFKEDFKPFQKEVSRDDRTHESIGEEKPLRLWIAGVKQMRPTNLGARRLVTRYHGNSSGHFNTWKKKKKKKTENLRDEIFFRRMHRYRTPGARSQRQELKIERAGHVSLRARIGESRVRIRRFRGGSGRRDHSS